MQYFYCPHPSHGVERTAGHFNPYAQMNNGDTPHVFEIELRAADKDGTASRHFEYASSAAKTPAEAIAEIASRPPNQIGQTPLREIDDQH